MDNVEFILRSYIEAIIAFLIVFNSLILFLPVSYPIIDAIILTIVPILYMMIPLLYFSPF